MALFHRICVPFRTIAAKRIGFLFAGWMALVAASAQAQETPEVRFVAYNLENYLSMSRRVAGEYRKSAPKPEAEKAVIISTLEKLAPDIIGVCEIGSQDDVEDLRSRLRGVGLSYPHIEWVDAADEDRHLALLSKYPIVERNSQVDLSYILGDKELPFQRGILDVTVQVGESYRLRCIGCHLKSKRPVPEGNQYLMRRNEAELVRAHVDGILAADPGANLLVYGDFNDTRNEAPIRAIQGKYRSPEYLTSLYLKDRYGMSWTHHWDVANVYARLDFVFVSRGIYREIDRENSFIHWNTDWEKGSDHRALAVCVKAADVAEIGSSTRSKLMAPN